MSNITKSTAEIYKIRNLPHGGWADITIDSVDEHGRISIASDYGDWQYFWSHCGTPFKEFLPTLGIDYVADKFRADEHLDADFTVKNFRKQVLESRKAGNLDKPTAQILWEEIKELDSVSANEFKQYLSSCQNLLAFYEHLPPLYDVIHPLFQRFWDECWSVFIEHLKAEISEGVAA